MNRRYWGYLFLLALATIMLGGMILSGSPVSAQFPNPDGSKQASQGVSPSVGNPAGKPSGDATPAERVVLPKAGPATIPSAAAATPSASAPHLAGAPTAPQPEAITAGTYAFTSSTGATLQDMSTGTTQLVAPDQDDTASSLVNIGFDYWFDGVRYAQFSANANGLIRLGTAISGLAFTNSLTSTTNVPQIAPYWDDLWTGTNGKVHYKVVGTAPNRKLVVEWLNEQIPRVAAGNTGAGTFQAWLYETTGVIEFVYGSGIAVNSANGGYSVGLQSGLATNFASVTTSGPTVSYATANNIQTDAISSGTKYTFTPNMPAAPTGLSFTGVSATSMTLNWTDNATNEFGYAVYISTDNVNFSFIGQLAANATSATVTGLTPNTTYYWKVYAVTEGALSSALSGSQATSPAGNISSVPGNPIFWSAPASWVGGVVPTANDNVTIVNGSMMIIDTTAVAYSVTVNNGGILQWDATTARTLTVGTFVTIDSGGTFRSATTGTQTGHALTVGTDLTNNGTLDFSTNTNTAGASITFTGAANSTFGGTGATTDVRAITINKGTSAASILDVNPTNFTVQGVATSTTVGFLTLTNGTFKLSGTFAFTNPIFAVAAYSIPATGGFWLNNPNATVAGQNSSPTNNGTLRVTTGTYNVGTLSGNSMGAAAGALFLIEGGTVNIAGRLQSASAVTYNQSGGNVNVATVGNAATTGSFAFTSASSSFIMSGGTINLVQPSTGTTKIDYRVSGATNITGGTLNIGTAATAAGSTFNIGGSAPNTVVDNTTNTKIATATAQTLIFGNLTIKTGTTLNLNGQTTLIIGTTITNNGTLTGTTAGSRLYFLGSGPQTYTGTGTVTAPLASLDLDNPAGLTIDPTTSGITTLRVNLFRGPITNSNKLTIGNGGATSAVVQVGVGGATAPGGSFDSAPTFNAGSGGVILIYAQETVARTTGFEVPPSRSVATVIVANTNGVTLAGGDLTITGTLTLTDGILTTGANTVLVGSAGTVTRTNGYVNGNFKKTFAAATTKAFEVGTANGYSPVTVTVTTAGSFPVDFTARAVQGPMPSIYDPTKALQRYWTLTATGLTADLTFNYRDPPDVPGTANEAAFVIVKYDGTLTQMGGTVDPANNRATITGVTSFSDWTLAEPAATFTPTATATPTDAATSTPTATNTPTVTPTPSDTPTVTNTPTDVPTNTPTVTNTSTAVPTNTPTDVPTNTPTNTPSDTPSDTPTATNTPSNTPTATNTPTITLTPTITQTPTRTFTPTSTVTQTRTPTNTATATATPNPCTNYGFTQTTGVIVTASPTVDTGNRCDDCNTSITLPFPYTFYDQVFSTALVNSNGNLAFTSASTTNRNPCLPTTAYNNNIFVYARDLNTTVNATTCPQGCGVFSSVSGIAPNRIFNLEWRAVLFGTSTFVNFELRLYEGQTRFDTIYGTMTTGSSTIGVQRDTGSAYTQFTCSTSPASGTQLNWLYPQAACPTSTPGASPTPTNTPTPTITRTPTLTATATSTPNPCLAYQVQPSVGTIVPGTLDSGNNCDDCTTAITLPFGITLYDQTFTTAQVGSNGTLTFGTGTNAFSNTCLAVGATTFEIFPYWDDQRTDCAGCGIFTTQVGGTFYIEYRTQLFTGATPENYEVVLTQGSPNFSIIYGTAITDSQSETIGVQRDTSNFTQYKCNSALNPITPGLQLTFTLPCITPTVTPTATTTNTVVPTATPTVTSTVTPTATPSDTPVPTNTPTDTPTNTPTDVPTNTPTATTTDTPLPSNTPIPTNTPTPVPTNTLTATATRTATPTPITCGTGPTVINGAVTTGDPTQTGRMTRNGVPSSCAVPKVYPGTNDTTVRRYDAYTFTNSQAVAVCVTVQLSNTCGNNVFSAAYLGSYNPASISTNYLADGGIVGGPLNYSFTVPANATFVIVVHEVTANAGCAAYTLTVSGCNVPTPTPTITLTPTTVATATCPPLALVVGAGNPGKLVAPVAPANSRASVQAAGKAGQPAAYPPARFRPLAPITFQLDDGTPENSIGFGSTTTETAAIWLNRFTPPNGSYPITLQSMAIYWPSQGANDPQFIGKTARLLFYKDADGDGNPANATLLAQQFVTVGMTNTFQTYPINVVVPGPAISGDIYVGFEDFWAEAGYTPRLFPAAIDTTSSQVRSWVLAGGPGGPPDTVNLSNNSTRGTIDSLGLPGNWLIRVSGDTGLGVCPSATPSSTPSETPTVTMTPVVTDTPTVIPTNTTVPTSTTTRTTTVTPTPPCNYTLNGHVRFQGLPQPHPGNVQTMTLKLQLTGGGPVATYVVTPDANGNFTVVIGPLPTGTYTYWIKGNRYLANGGTMTLAASCALTQDFGTQRAGDINNDNCVDVTDFTLQRASYGTLCGDPAYNATADYNDDCLVDVIDFSLLRSNYGTCGPLAPTGAAARK